MVDWCGLSIAKFDHPSSGATGGIQTTNNCLALEAKHKKRKLGVTFCLPTTQSSCYFLLFFPLSRSHTGEECGDPVLTLSLSLLTLYVNKVSLQYPTYQLSQSHTGNDLFKCRRKRSQSHWGTKGWTWSSYGQNTSWISRISTAKASANPLEALATHLCCSLGKLQSSSLEVKARQTLQKDTETDDGNKKWGKKLSLTSSCYACWLVAIPIIDYDDS